MTSRNSLDKARRKVTRLVEPIAKPAGRFARDTLGVSPAVLERVRSVALPTSGPALVEITAVTMLPRDGAAIPHLSIEQPFAGSRFDIHALRCFGTIANVPGLTRVEAMDDDRVVCASPIQGVGGPESEQRAADGRFRLLIGTVGLPSAFTLRIEAVFEDGRRIGLATIAGTRRLVQSGYAPALRPLLLTAMGRSGTTWAMRLFSEHPQIVVHAQYPYEVRAAAYWMHTFEVLSRPADPIEAPRAGLASNPHRVGHNPFYSDTLGGPVDVLGWFGRDQVQRLAAQAQQTIDDFYLRVAAAQGQRQPAFFAEKFSVSNTLSATGELYPDLREVFLVRDFRDVVSSMLAFNAKRNRLGFGRRAGQDDAAYIRQLREQQVAKLLSAWHRRSASAHLIRYEDLILKPAETLTPMLAFLGIDHDDQTVAAVLRKASDDSDTLAFHRTTSNPAASIGRWRTDLPAELQQICTEVMGDALAEFGYEG